MTKNLILILICQFVLLAASAQENDKTLFSINGKEVPVSEFLYIYNKNNNDKDKYSKKSLNNYLDLYINFKLKVEEARALGLDTLPKLREELKGYQKQLADSYLMDKQIKHDILKEAYDRSLVDVELAHILIRLSRNITGKDTLEPYKRMLNIKKQIDAGILSFEEAVEKYSEDKNSRKHGGNIGFVNAVLPTGFYDFETVAYTSPIGSLSMPVRSNLGYHLVKVLSKRPARGKMEAAHILIRKPKEKSDYIKASDKAQMIYKELKRGLKWEEAVEKYSEDASTKTKKGNLGVFGISKFERTFEDAAFALKKDGDISKPIETRYGWHIIKRISKKTMPKFEQAKILLDNRLKNDERILRAREIVIEKIKAENNIQHHKPAYRQIIQQLDSSFFSYRWQGIPNIKKQPLFTIEEMKVYNTDFINYLKKQRGKRIRTKRYKQLDIAVQKLYDSFFEDKLLEFEKRNLAKKFPDFKALMKEYDEGILLFEVTKRKIWDFASKDSLGLEKFFSQHRNKYRWPERIAYTKYEINPKHKKHAKKIRKYARKQSAPEVFKKFSQGKNILKYHSNTINRNAADIPKPLLTLKAGKTSKITFDPDTKKYIFYKLDKFIEPTLKKLDEARGFVIADYQDYLEKQWLKELKNKYKVQINHEVLNQLAKN